MEGGMELEPEQNGKSTDVPNGKCVEANSRPEQLKCSLCGRVFLRSESKTLPFCSKRCQQIDLGNWLGEKYGFPVESENGETEPSEDEPEN